MSQQPLRALVWSAVSTLEQADDDKFSLDAQITDAQSIAATNGWAIIDTIRIDGHSRNYRTLAKLADAARKKQELGFDRLVTHLDNCDFDILICRDANRFARKASLLYEIVDTILEDCHARIYSLADGWVTVDNADMWLMVKGYEIRKQMRWLSTEMQRGRYKLVEQGLPMGSEHVWSHMRLRDDKHRAVAFVPDPSKTPVIEQAAKLIINRASWQHIERDMFALGFGQDGKAFTAGHFYQLFYNPWFWGDAARNHSSPAGRKKGLWIFDPSEPLPPGVEIHRGKIEPAITGELALQLRAELIRRLNFRPRNHADTHLFSGLLVCERCGFMLIHSRNSHASYYTCQSKHIHTPRPKCEKKWAISERKVQAYFNAVLRIMLDTNNPYMLAVPDDAPPVDPVEPLNNQLSVLETQIRRLITKQATAADSLASLYDEQIAGLAQQRENLTRQIATVTDRQSRINTADIEAAFRELSTIETMDAFWQSNRAHVNQILHRLMGKRRLTMKDRTITGSVEWLGRPRRITTK